MEKSEERKLHVLEDLQEAIVQAGGNFQRRRNLEDTYFGQILDLCSRNHIQITFSYSPPKAKKVLAEDIEL